MTENLLLYVRQHPGDTLARLAYADWLEEQGSPNEITLAELLRIRARLATLTANDSRYSDLAARESTLLQAYGATWHTTRQQRFLIAGTCSRTKPHVNVGTIGHSDHGKTTLTAAIVARQAHRNGRARYKCLTEVAGSDVFRDCKAVAVAPSYSEYETANRHYAHVDCHGHPDSLRNTIVGTAQMDGAILVVDADAGPMPQTREHLLLARQTGIAHVVVFLNKIALVADPDLHELEVRELLAKYDFPGDEVPIIRGNALPALLSNGMDDAACRCIDDLLDELDRSIPLPLSQEDRPFLMPVAGAFAVSGCGAVATGRIWRGKVKAADEVEILGLAKQTRRAVVGSVEIFRKSVVEGLPCDNVGLLLPGLDRADLRRGQALAMPGSLRPHTQFVASVYVLSKSEGGRHTPFVTGYCPQFYFGTARVSGAVTLQIEMAMPGDCIEMAVQLFPGSSVALEEGQRFVIREGGRSVGSGCVTRILA